MTGILLTRTALAAGVDALRQEMAGADDAIAAVIGVAGLNMLHAVLCCAQDVELSVEAGAPPPDDAAEALPAPEDDLPEDDTATEPAAENAAPPAAQAGRALVWTAERKAWLAQHYPASTDNAAVLDALNALPGLPITSIGSVYIAASNLGVRRLVPTGWQRTVAWTEARNAALRAGVAEGQSLVALLVTINALPGPSIKTVKAVKTQIYKLGLRRRASPAGAGSPKAAAKAAGASFPPAHFRAPAVVAEPAPEVVAEDTREAEALIRTNPDRWHGRAIADEYGWSIDQAAAFVRQVRAAMAAERKDAAE